MAFTHLHLHTEYSLLDGMARIDKLVERAKEYGMDSVAVTDHGVMYGAVHFYRACKKAGIKPIIGCEVYTAPRGIAEKDRERGHLILLAKNNEGYTNLCKIVSAGFLEGFYVKPRIDKAILGQYSDGIICLSACVAGEVQKLLLAGRYEDAKKEALSLRDIFGGNNFFIEMQNHGVEYDERLIGLQKQLSDETGIPLVATNDVHYIDRKDAYVHDVLLAMQTKTTVMDEKRMRFDNDEFYFKSEEEMRGIFVDMPDVCDRTAEIAERCNVEFVFGEYHLPEFDAPPGKDKSVYLRELCFSGLIERYGEEAAKDGNPYRERLDKELGIIESMHFVDYFLIVWDYVSYAVRNDIPVGPGRGSAAGSLVANCLGITDLDPLKYDLIFERFLNPERISMPDIDMDFCIEGRQDVINYVINKYGKDKVSQIITFGTMKAKAAVRDVARALGEPYSKGDELAKKIPNELHITIEKALEANPDLRDMYEDDPSVRKIIDIAMEVEGMPRNESTHAAGVVISKEPLASIVPLYRSKDDVVATQFDMEVIGELGLLKMDLLGLKNLTMIRHAVDGIEKNRGIRPDFSSQKYDDPAVYKIISDGNTAGLFQLESKGMTDFMKRLKPSRFEDIIAGIALYRPGPMDSIDTYIENSRHPENIKYMHPALEPILNITYGCMIYQEQVMHIVRELAGYSFARSDVIRKAMSKKKMDVMREEKHYFIYGKKDKDGNAEIPGCIENGIPKEAAEEIFDAMMSFGEYAFNKSHAAAYAVISYETAYLKAHYPAEYMAALISGTTDSAAKVSMYMRNCEEMGIEILPPSITKSDADFKVEDGKIRFGLKEIKSVGADVIDTIIEARRKNGGFTDIFDFADAVAGTERGKKPNKKAIAAMIKAGAFDCLHDNRAAMLAIIDQTLDEAQKRAKDIDADQVTFFQLSDDFTEDVKIERELPKVADFTDRQRLAMEKEATGVFLSGHPLDEYGDLIKTYATANTSDLSTGKGETDYMYPDAGAEALEEGGKVKDGSYVIMAGEIAAVKIWSVQKGPNAGKMMARLVLEDYFGSVEVVVFPSAYSEYKGLIEEGAIVAVAGRIKTEDEAPSQVLLDDMAAIEDIDTLNRSGRGPKDRRTRSYDSRPPEASNVQEHYGDPLGDSNAHAGQKPTGGGTSVTINVTYEVVRNFGGVPELMNDLASIMSEYPGNSPMVIDLPNGKQFRVRSENGVDLTGDLLQRLGEIFSEENVKTDN